MSTKVSHLKQAANHVTIQAAMVTMGSYAAWNGGKDEEMWNTVVLLSRYEPLLNYSRAIALTTTKAGRSKRVDRVATLFRVLGWLEL